MTGNFIEKRYFWRLLVKFAIKGIVGIFVDKIGLDKLNRPSPMMHQVNQYSLNRLYRWITAHSAEKNILLNGYLSTVISIYLLNCLIYVNALKHFVATNKFIHYWWLFFIIYL